MLKSLPFAFAVGLILLPPSNAFVWKNGASAAVSITADDGWPSQANDSTSGKSEVTILEEHGFRGTFYLAPKAMPDVLQNISTWRGVFQRGHEVANHSWSHFCNLEEKKWPEVAADVAMMEQWLLANIYAGSPTPHTYAYPCGGTTIGSTQSEQSTQVGTCEYLGIVSIVANAARTGAGSDNNPDLFFTNRFRLNGVSVTDYDGQDALQAAKNAIDLGINNHSWVILVFHSLGDVGDGNSISRDQYTSILDYLLEHKDRLWVAPVITVEQYIANSGAVRQSPWSCAQP
jgi:peptidoglycan/xylan/chitin deacetylase (PgdA/CDA1 family)